MKVLTIGKYILLASLLIETGFIEARNYTSMPFEATSVEMAMGQEKGVSHELAILRAQEVRDVAYQVKFRLPKDKKTLVSGKVTI